MFVARELEASWNSLVPVGKDLVVSWSARCSVAASLDLSWSVLAVVSNSANFRWVVCAMANSRPRGSATGITPLPNSGSFIYQDDYGQLYRNEWHWVYDHTVLDLTVVIEQPYVWGEKPQGQFRGKDLYRRGIVTVHRSVMKPIPGGYELIAEGHSQYIDWVRSSFHCSPLPVDPFLYHLDQGMTDLVETDVTKGPRFAAPDRSGDSVAVWGNVDGGGNVSGGPDTLHWIDVWHHPNP